MVTSNEQRAIQLENAEDEQQFWGAMHDMNSATAEDSIRLIALAEAKLNEHNRAAAGTIEQCEVAKERLAKLKCGESVSGGLGKKLDVVARLKASGFTARQMKRALLLASLTDEGFRTLLQRTDPVAAVDKALDRQLRRLTRERP